MRKATTAKISSHVCSARNQMACPAVLKRKETIEPTSPGRIEAIFSPFLSVFPKSLPVFSSPFPKALPVAFKALVIVPMTEPIVTPAARTIAVNVTPCFLKMSYLFKKLIAFHPLNLFCQRSDFFITLCHSFFCCCFFGGLNIFIFNN